MRNRFVKVVRVRYKDALECTRSQFNYEPVELRNGNLYALSTGEGFDNPADAWKVIDKIEALQE